MLSTIQVFQYRYRDDEHKSDFPEYMDGVSSAMASSLFCIKLIIIWTHYRYLLKLPLSKKMSNDQLIL